MSDQRRHQLEQLKKLVAKAKEALEKAQTLADKHGLSFKWDGDYGSRKQEYYGKGSSKPGYDFKTGNLATQIIKEGEWVSSSDDC